ncbi:hypothetical protein FIBSPDRAFT_882834 [Athelia psychrophila]|uniref:Uncharacterized protein n=1 Tax=Athelia psychrophila TaxID=1759441 RepID=A0A166URL3_9AGAM|nr:hypothetical protein FIBSPDRAFT_882834 [Fibularhizoctonia sp. CBS 109695]
MTSATRLCDSRNNNPVVLAAEYWALLALFPQENTRFIMGNVRLRALVLAPTHELSRQLASPTKALLHIFKLRVLCASRANAPSNPRASGTTAKMATDMAALSIAGEAGSEFQVRQGTERARVVDVMASTPNKVPEITRGRGWNWDEPL